MEKLVDEKSTDLKLPKDVPDGFFNIVSQILNFVESVDQLKNKSD